MATLIIQVGGATRAAGPTESIRNITTRLAPDEKANDLEYCNSDIYFDIDLEEKTRALQSCLCLFPRQTSRRFATVFEMSHFEARGKTRT